MAVRGMLTIGACRARGCGHRTCCPFGRGSADPDSNFTFQRKPQSLVSSVDQDLAIRGSSFMSVLKTFCTMAGKGYSAIEPWPEISPGLLFEWGSHEDEPEGSRQALG